MSSLEDAELVILRRFKQLLDDAPADISRGCDLNRTRRIANPADVPRLVLGYGEDEVIEDAMTYSDNVMDAAVTCIVRDGDEHLTEQLAAMRRFVHEQIIGDSGDRTLGLGNLVIDVAPAGASAPMRPQRDTDMPVVMRELLFRVRYRTDPIDRGVPGA